MRGLKGDPVDDSVEPGAGKRPGYGGSIFDVNGYGVGSGRRTNGMTAAGQKRNVDAAFDGQVRAGSADDTGSTDE